MSKREAVVRAIIRFMRTAIPQIPAITVYLADQAKVFNAPEWVVPTLMFVGAIATALDKFLRSINE